MKRQHPSLPEPLLSLLTKREVAAVLNVSGKTVDRLIKNSKLKVLRINRSVRITREEINRYVKKS